jgi:hypothetical protein
VAVPPTRKPINLTAGPLSAENQDVKSLAEFTSEEALVNAFLAQLSGPGNDHPFRCQSAVTREIFYDRGKTDIVLVTNSGEVLAVEAKLARWRSALVQAYRNTCYAHRSFVLLPWGAAQQASRYDREFERRGVGLCAVHQNGDVVILRPAETRDPIEPWLSDRARSIAFSFNRRLAEEA